MKPDYDTTVARIAGNIASGLVASSAPLADADLVATAVLMARAIVAEVRELERQDHNAAVQKDRRTMVQAVVGEREAKP
jgi:hypothetical protein